MKQIWTEDLNTRQQSEECILISDRSSMSYGQGFLHGYKQTGAYEIGREKDENCAIT